MKPETEKLLNDLGNVGKSMTSCGCLLIILAALGGLMLVFL